MPDHSDHIEREEEEKEEEVLVIFVPQAIVHERAVVVKPLDALVAVVAMHCVLGSQVLAIDADVVQVELLVDESFHQAQEVLFQWNVPRVNQGQAVEGDCKGEENCI